MPESLATAHKRPLPPDATNDQSVPAPAPTRGQRWQSDLFVGRARPHDDLVRDNARAWPARMLDSSRNLIVVLPKLWTAEDELTRALAAMHVHFPTGLVIFEPPIQSPTPLRDWLPECRATLQCVSNGITVWSASMLPILRTHSFGHWQPTGGIKTLLAHTRMPVTTDLADFCEYLDLLLRSLARFEPRCAWHSLAHLNAIDVEPSRLRAMHAGYAAVFKLRETLKLFAHGSQDLIDGLLSPPQIQPAV